MSKKIFLIGMTIVALLSFNSCEKSINKSDLVGTWTSETEDYPEIIEFNEDGSFNKMDLITNMKGSWSIENGNLTLKTDLGMEMTGKCKSSNNKLIYDGSGRSVSYHKISERESLLLFEQIELQKEEAMRKYAPNYQ